MTEQKCETCLRHGRSCTGGVPEWTCKQIRLQKTNADRIRAMSVEELAQEIANLVDHSPCSDGGCIIRADGKCGWPGRGCDESALDWLQSPAEGEIENGA